METKVQVRSFPFFKALLTGILLFLFSTAFTSPSCSSNADTDGDGMPDAWEAGYDCVDGNVYDPDLDPDGDGLTNIAEYTNAINPCIPDTDGDGLGDGTEVLTAGTNPNLADTDGDGLCDGANAVADTCISGEDMNQNGVVDPNETDPANPDTDGDSMHDGWEQVFSSCPDIDPLNPGNPSADGDSDGLSNLEESGVGTNPCDPDTDGDGLNDGLEVLTAGTNPNLADTDGDGLCDGADAVADTCISGEDMDMDGVVDPNETDPANSDTDGDSMNDGWEHVFSSSCPDIVDPLAAGDSLADGDIDGLSNLEESGVGTNPCDPDTDGDGLNDGLEVNTAGTNPNLADTDGDGLCDGGDTVTDICDSGEDMDMDGVVDSDETDPKDPDTDGDLGPDGWERAYPDDCLNPLVENGYTSNFDPGQRWLTGRVIDKGLQRPIPGVLVSVYTGTQTLETYTSRDGTYLVPGRLNVGEIYPVEFTFDVWGDNSVLKPRYEELKGETAELKPINGDSIINVLDVEMKNLGSTDKVQAWQLYGRITDGNGNPVEQEIYMYFGMLKWQISPGGYYNLALSTLNMAEGETGFDILIGAPGYQDWYQNDLVLSGLTVELNVTMTNNQNARPTGVLNLYVKYGDDFIVGGAPINFKDKVEGLRGGVDRTIYTISQAATPYMLEPGLYDITVSVPGFDVKKLENYRVEPNTTSTLTFYIGHDEDRDGLSLWEEYKYGTDPCDGDSDGDEMPDGWEVRYGLKPNLADATGNPDDDDLDNRGEYDAGSDPTVADTDKDGLTDGQEVGNVDYPTDPTLADSDTDGLSDGEEVLSENPSNPNMKDTDGDGYTDWHEVVLFGTTANEYTTRTDFLPKVLDFSTDELYPVGDEYPFCIVLGNSVQEELYQAGFNCYSPYKVYYKYEQTDQTDQLDYDITTAGDNGLFVFLGWRYVNDEDCPIRSTPKDCLYNDWDDLVFNLQSHTNICWWVMPEEMADWTSATIKKGNTIANAISDNDSRKRPTFMFLTTTSGVGGMDEYNKGNVSRLQMFAHEAYVDYANRARTLVRWTMEETIKAIDIDYTDTSPPRAPILTLQLARWGNKNVNFFSTTGVNAYHDVWLGIIHGAKGVVVYNYDNKDHLAPEAWNQYRVAAYQVNGPARLGEVLLDEQGEVPIETVTVDQNPPADPFYTWGEFVKFPLQKYDTWPSISWKGIIFNRDGEDYLYLFMVNSDDGPISNLEICMPKNKIPDVAGDTYRLPNDAIAEVMFEGTTIELTNKLADKCLNDDFDAFGVHIYKLRVLPLP